MEGWIQGVTAYGNQMNEGNPLVTMNAFPALPTLGTAPAAPLSGIWKFIADQRTIWMKSPNWSTAIGEDMQLLGAEQSFETNTYKPTLKTVIEEGVITVKTTSTHIDHHRLSASI